MVTIVSQVDPAEEVAPRDEYAWLDKRYLRSQQRTGGVAYCSRIALRSCFLGVDCRRMVA